MATELGKVIRSYYKKQEPVNELKYYIDQLDTYIKNNYKKTSIIDFQFELLPDNKDTTWLFDNKDYYSKVSLLYEYCKKEDIKVMIHKPTKDPESGLYNLNFTINLLEPYN